MCSRTKNLDNPRKVVFKMKNIIKIVFVFVFGVVLSISSPNVGMGFANDQNVGLATKNVVDYCIVSVNSEVFNNIQFKKTVIKSLSKELTILVKRSFLKIGFFSGTQRSCSKMELFVYSRRLLNLTTKEGS